MLAGNFLSVNICKILKFEKDLIIEIEALALGQQA
jgi:hypothetical protein